MATKQINWGYQFKRNFKGPIDPDTTFSTYEEMSSSSLLYNGAIVSVSNDSNSNNNGIYLVTENSNGGYNFQKGSGSSSTAGFPFLLTYSAIVTGVEYQSTSNNYKVTLNNNGFANLDFIGWGISDDLSSGNYALIDYISGKDIYLSNSSKRPSIGDTIYRVGNSVDPSRATFPAIYLKDGYGYYTIFENTDINNINSTIHTSIGKDNTGNALLYSLNAYLKGTFISTDGEDLGNAVTSLRSELSSGLDSLREEVTIQNRITNPFFLDKLKGWTTTNDAQFFKTLQGKWIWNTNKSKSQDGLYALKRKGAYIDTFDDKICVSLQEGVVSQLASDLKEIVSNTTEEFPKLMNISFMYYVVQKGTLIVTIGNSSATFNLDKSSKWAQLRTQLSWNGTDALEISFKSGTAVYGEIKIRAVNFQENEIETFKNKYSELLSYSDTLIKMAKEYNQ